MAAPNFSAETALLQQRLLNYTSIYLPATPNEQDLTVLSIFKKNLLMSTAVPHAKNGEPYASPRKQGAGVVNVDALCKNKSIRYSKSQRGRSVSTFKS